MEGSTTTQVNISDFFSFYWQEKEQAEHGVSQARAEVWVHTRYKDSGEKLNMAEENPCTLSGCDEKIQEWAGNSEAAMAATEHRVSHSWCSSSASTTHSSAP